MKNQLIHQTSCYDCGPTSITNAMRFLFEREEIPPVLLKHIWTMGLDAYADGGEPGKAGTSKASMRYMAAWLECFADKCGFPLKATFLDMDFAAIQSGSLAWKCLERGGCAVVRVWHRAQPRQPAQSSFSCSQVSAMARYPHSSLSRASASSSSRRLFSGYSIT